MAKVSKSVRYHYLDYEAWRPVEGGTETTLLSAIRAALNQKRNGEILGEHPPARIADMQQSGQLTLLNRIEGLNSDAKAFSGQLVLYRKDTDVPALAKKLKKNKNYFDIIAYTTKDQPVEGVLYFVVIDNHVGMIESNAVKNQWLERYLTWLLKDATSIIDGENRIELNAKIILENNGEDLPPMNEFVLHPKANVREGEREEETSHLARQTGGIVSATVLDILTVLGFSKEDIDNLFDNIPEGGTLEGDFRVFIKNKGRKYNFAADTLDRVFRNIEGDGDLKLSGKRGKFSNGILRLSESVRIEKKGSQLDDEDAIRQIVQQMERWIEQGMINYPAS